MVDNDDSKDEEKMSLKLSAFVISFLLDKRQIVSYLPTGVLGTY